MIKDLRLALKAISGFDVVEFFGNRLVKMGIIGAIGFSIQFLIFEIIGIQLDLVSPSTATLIGAEVAIISNFLLNNRFTFHEERIPFSILMIGKFFKFNIAAIFSLLAQWIVMSFGEGIAGGSDLILRLFSIGGVLIGFTINYASYTHIIWKKPIVR